MDLAGLIGYYSFVSVTLNVFEVPIPPDAKLLSEIPGALIPVREFSNRPSSRITQIQRVNRRRSGTPANIAASH